jgi:hypothetical protein
MKRTQMVVEGTKELIETEEAVAAALALVGTLPQRLERLRRAGGVSAVVSGRTMRGIARAFNAMTEAHSGILEVHEALDEVKTRLGCRHVLSGTTDDKGTGDGTHTVPPTGFHVVGDQDAA